MTRQITHRLAQLATASTLIVFAWSLALHHPDAASAREAGQLAVLIAAVLLALSVSSRTAPAVVTGGGLIGFALCLPAAMGTRGALVGALLTATVAWCTWRAFAGGRAVRFLDVAAVAIAWQALLRSDRLLDLSPQPASVLWLSGWLLALPLVAAGAATLLARRRGGPAAFTVLAMLIVLIPGAGVVPVAALVVIALTRLDGPSSAATALGSTVACSVAIWRLPSSAPALLILAASLALNRFAGWRWLPAVGSVAWALGRWAILGAGEGVGTTLGWLLLGLPLALSAGSTQRPLALAGLGLALGSASDADPALLAPAVALLALAVPIDSWRQRLQAGWSLAILSGFSTAAAYPWLRRPTLDLPSHVAGVPVLAIGLLIVVASLIATRMIRLRPPLRPLWAGPLLLLLGLGLASSLRSSAPLLTSEAIVLSAKSAVWQTPIGPESVRSLTIDSFLTRSGGIASGRVVAVVRLVAADGERRELSLRHGEQTADWAARRLGRDDAPPPWLSWVAPDGSLAQRYRVTWSLPSPFPAERLEIVRRNDLPPDLELALLQVSSR